MENKKMFDWFLFALFVANLCISLPLGDIPLICGWSCASIVQLRICLTK